MLVNTTCPNCGAQLNMDDSKDQFFCTFCGTKIVNVAQKVEVNQTIQQNIVHSGKIEYKLDRSSDPTLDIHFSTINPQVKMVVRVIDTNQTSVFINGQNMSYHLAPGRHDLVLKIGRNNYNKTIYVPEDHTPVHIYASFDGRARITIDQPNYTIPQIQNINQAYSNNLGTYGGDIVNRPKPSWMSILGFVLSFLYYFAFIGLGLCVWDIIKNNEKRPKGLSIAGIIISSFMVILILFSLFNRK